MTQLDLGGCLLREADGQALGAALQSGVLPQLRGLNLGSNPIKDEGMLVVLEALAAGSYTTSTSGA